MILYGADEASVHRSVMVILVLLESMCQRSGHMIVICALCVGRWGNYQQSRGHRVKRQRLNRLARLRFSALIAYRGSSSDVEGKFREWRVVF